jgi:ribosomal protein S18 acetylase RimI-like enzyme
MTATIRRQMQLNMVVTFRPAERTDLSKLEWGGEYTHFRRVFQQAFGDQRNGQRLMLIADMNNYPIGHVFIQFESYDDSSDSTGKRGYFYSLRVMTPFQGRGLGTALIHEGERLLREREYESVSIAAAKDNPGARRLYERLGYKVYMEDSGRWNYVDHEGRVRHVYEPCYLLEKFFV